MASMITIKFGAPNNRYTHGALQKWFFGVKFGKEIIGCILTFFWGGKLRFPTTSLEPPSQPGRRICSRGLDIQQNMQNITRIAIDLWFSMVESNSNKSTWTNPRTTCFGGGIHVTVLVIQLNNDLVQQKEIPTARYIGKKAGNGGQRCTPRTSPTLYIVHSLKLTASRPLKKPG